MSAFQPFLQYFAAGSDTASCQDYEKKEFVECFSEETQIIDIFTHCKLQPTLRTESNKESKISREEEGTSADILNNSY